MSLTPQRISEYVGEFKRRREALLAWRPARLITVALSAASLVGAGRSFIASGGELSLPVFGFLLLAVVLFVCIPEPWVRLFILRALSFFLDVLILITATALFMVTAQIVATLRGAHVHMQSALSLEIATWAWFLYFGLSDHLLSGTPGKRLLGLRIVPLRGEGRPGLLVSLLRALCILPVPVVAACCATWYLKPFSSRLNFVAAMAVREAALCLVPVSMLFYGGDQSIVDVPFRTAVRKTRQEVQARTPPRWSFRRRTTFFAAAVAGVALALAGVNYIAMPALFGATSRAPAGSGMVLSTYEESPQIEKVLRDSLASGPRPPSQQIAYVAIYHFSRNTFKPAPLLKARATPDYLKGYSTQKNLPVIRVALIPPTSSLVKGEVLSVVGGLMDSGVALKSRPFFVGVQLYSFLHAGPVRLTYAETSLLCLLESGSKPLPFYDEMHPWSKVGIDWSPDFTARLLLLQTKAVQAMRPWA